MKNKNEFKKSIQSMLRNRHNKIAKGMTFTDERRVKMTGKRRANFAIATEKQSDVNSLSYYGTLDSLKKMVNHSIKKKVIEHPKDRGYFKTVYVLSDIGKSRLKSLRYQRSKMVVASDYKHIEAWGKMMGSFAYYIENEQRKALAINAPIDTVYLDGEIAHTFSQIQNPDAVNFINNYLNK